MTDAPVSAAMIARRLGLSQPTVSHVLNNRGRYSTETRNRVLQAAEAMGYRPSAAARAMRSRRTRQVGVLVRNDVALPAYYPQAYEMIQGLNLRFGEEGLLLSLVRYDDARSGDDAACRIFSEHLLDGIVVVEDLPEEMISRLDTLNEQIVWLDSSVWRETCCIKRDEFHAGELATRGAAINAGYRRLFWAGMSPGYVHKANRVLHYSLAERFSGVQQTAGGISVVHPATDPSGYEDRIPRVEQLSPTDCVIAYDTPTARRVAHVAHAKGKVVGRDFGLCCCDSTLELGELWPELARVNVSRYEMGRLAGEMMIGAIDGRSPASRVCPVAWIDGSTLRT